MPMPKIGNQAFPDGLPSPDHPDQLNFGPVQDRTALTPVSMSDQTRTGLDQTAATLILGTMNP